MISRIDLVGQNGNTGEHYMSDKEQYIIVELLEVMESAIASEDWKVDGACDPSVAMDRAEILLTRAGWTRDKRTAVWVKIC